MFRDVAANVIRMFRREGFYSSINIFGLSFSLTAVIVVFLFVRDEFSFDRQFLNAGQIYRVTTSLALPGRPPLDLAESPVNIGPQLKLFFPEISDVTRFVRQSAAIRQGTIDGTELIYSADTNFFKFFDLPVAFGDLPHSLERPNSIVLTEHFARKYFGRADAVGSTLQINGKEIVYVTAVLKDLPSNTHLDTEIILPSSNPESGLSQQSPADDGFVKTYLLIPNGANSVIANMRDFTNRNFPSPPAGSGAPTTSFEIGPLASIHFDSHRVGDMRPQGDRVTAYAMLGIAALLVIISSINFINLSTARSAQRGIEVGIRKAFGSTKLQLVVRFLGESILLTLLSLLISIAVVETSLGMIDRFLGRDLHFDYFSDPALLITFFSLLVVIGLGAGAYPAFVLSSFNPTKVLHAATKGGSARSAFKTILLVIQFGASIFLAIATTTVYRQTAFVSDKQALIYDKNLVLLVPGLDGPDSKMQEILIRDRIRTLPGVESASLSYSVPTDQSETAGRGRWAGSNHGEDTSFSAISIDEDFFKVYGLETIAGRTFLTDRADALGPSTGGNLEGGVILNQAAVRAMGFESAQAAVGQVVNLSLDKENCVGHVVGVVPDFPMKSVRDVIAPTIFYVMPSGFRDLSVKLKPADIAGTLSSLDATWKELVPSRPIRRFFLADRVDGLYQDISRESEVFACFSVVAAITACLGLFGLSVAAAAQRTKEIGIRKALGATSGQIVGLLLWQFLKPVLIANILACPIAFLVMTHWLESFAYRLPLSIFLLVLTAIGSMVVGSMTVGWHAIWTARRSPVTALRYE